jgi:hypothetical protein
LARIKRQTRQGDLAYGKTFVVVGHSRPSPLALAKFDGQPHDRRWFVSNCEQARRSALDHPSHIGRPLGDKKTVSFADKNAVVPD